jgi:phage recombination protein Bet
MSEKGAATKAQVEFLKSLGASTPPADLSANEASDWIDEVRAYRRAAEAGQTPASNRADMMQVPPSRAGQPTQAQEPKAAGESKPVPEKPVEAPGFQTALEVLDDKKGQGKLTLEQVTLMKSMGRFPQDASQTEMAFGMGVANRLALSPLRKQIRFIRFSRNEPIEPFVTIDGLSSIASRTGQYAGMDLPVFVMDSEHPEVPVSVTVTAYRMVQGQRCAFAAVVRWREFAKKDREGNLTRAWAEMPTHMLAKVARAQALRMAFPEELSGVYEESEAPTE